MKNHRLHLGIRVCLGGKNKIVGLLPHAHTQLLQQARQVDARQALPLSVGAELWQAPHHCLLSFGHRFAQSFHPQPDKRARTRGTELNKREKLKRH